MKLVIAIEGVDGSGKSSLAQYIQRLCEEHGQTCSLIGRRAGHITPTIARLSQVLRDEVRHLTPQADVFLRVAREYQRAGAAACVAEGIVLLDRFVLTVLSLARVYGQDVDGLIPFLRDIAGQATLQATIFVHCPFEVAWHRVERRRPGSSLRRRAQGMLRQVADFMVEDFQSGLLTGEQWPVDNSGPFEQGQEQVAHYLLPHFEAARGQEPQNAEKQ
jgi:thymidylate kinase